MDQTTHRWLNDLCNLTPGVIRAVVFIKTELENQFSLAAQWPNKLVEHETLAKVARDTITSSNTQLLNNQINEGETGEPRDIISCPLFVDEKIYGAVVVDLYNRVSVKQQEALQQISNAAYWYKTFLEQHSSTEKKQLVTIVELVATCLEHDKFHEAATDVATDLTTRLAADRVSIGFLDGSTLTVEAVSHSAGFDKKSNLVRDMGEAMHEAIDQNSSVSYPPPHDSILPTDCHAALAEEHRLGSLLSVPFAVNGAICGAVLFERPLEKPFDPATMEYCEQIVAMTGPILNTRRLEERGLLRRFRASLQKFFSKLAGAGHSTFKLGTAAAVVILAMLLFIKNDYRVTGDARLEAQKQRVIVAPQNGYIATANFRPGDIVKQGDLLATLDNKDLALEYRKWSSQLGQLTTEYRDSLARHDRSSISIIQARIAQTEAQMELVGEQMLRTQLTAPFDGLVVSGDLTQALGSPVERGQVLFTVAPLDVYRILLQIDERDISNVAQGQEGSLVLSGMPGKSHAFAVGKITPVSTTEEGRNFFQVEAKITEDPEMLRPGMEGVAKITVDRRPLIWIWTHRLFDWMRLTLWKLLP
ncbi:MAG: HlyD family efflux transporter periplasmic adaptor subunit [Desulfofustis sp.]|nr:HlyD family efflux transporter periplasmic adaptor subunit [Desulfofustis sp.]